MHFMAWKDPDLMFCAFMTSLKVPSPFLATSRYFLMVELTYLPSKEGADSAAFPRFLYLYLSLLTLLYDTLNGCGSVCFSLAPEILLKEEGPSLSIYTTYLSTVSTSPRSLVKDTNAIPFLRGSCSKYLLDCSWAHRSLPPQRRKKKTSVNENILK
jgi:hypothetical protein